MAGVLGALGLIALGVVVLVLGGEWLVRGASRLAVALKVAPLVIGLTVVAFGTSAPELAVSLKAALSGQADLAVGNVVGSNIFNVLFILGLSSLIVPLAVSPQLVRFDVPFMIFTALLGYGLSLDGRLGVLDGIGLMTLLLFYVAWSVYLSRRQSRAAVKESDLELELSQVGQPHVMKNVGLIVLGLIGLALGSGWLVRGATTIAQLLGVSELVIGLTIVSIGTSLPEVVASLIASLRGERDIAVGNVVGSNIFNVLSVLGIPSILASDGIGVSSSVLAVDFPVMIAVSLATFPIFFTGHCISRGEGVLFLSYYAAYTAHLILQATGHASSDMLSRLLVNYAIPATTLGLMIAVIISLFSQPASVERSNVASRS